MELQVMKRQLQGLMAGINAHLKVMKSFNFKR
jgi:hypothetical protein